MTAAAYFAIAILLWGNFCLAFGANSRAYSDTTNLISALIWTAILCFLLWWGGAFQ